MRLRDIAIYIYIYICLRSGWLAFSEFAVAGGSGAWIPGSGAWILRVWGLESRVWALRVSKSSEVGGFSPPPSVKSGVSEGLRV